MAIVRAVKSGNWSDTTVWNTGALPTSADDVYSNTFTVTIDVSPTVLSISNAATTGVTAGGSFVPNNGITLTCTAATGITNGTLTNTVASSLGIGQSCQIIANIRCSNTGNTVVLNHNGAGIVNITGNLNAGSNGGGGSSTAVSNNSTGTVNITGTVTGGGLSQALVNASSGVVNVTGDVTSGSSGSGILNNSTGTVNVTGTVTGATATSGAAGVANNSTGTVNVSGTLVASLGPAVVSVSLSGVAILTGPFLTNASGVNPVYAARWFWQNTTPPATYYQIRSANLAVIRPLYTADSVGGNPAVTNVRSGTVYGPNNELTGTCAVPPAASVVVGVPVDNTTGTAAIDGASIRAAIGLASANLDAQLSNKATVDQVGAIVQGAISS